MCGGNSSTAQKQSSIREWLGEGFARASEAAAAAPILLQVPPVHIGLLGAGEVLRTALDVEPGFIATNDGVDQAIVLGLQR